MPEPRRVQLPKRAAPVSRYRDQLSPINPNATQPARNLLCYLYEVHETGVLSGQQETSWNPNPNDDVNWYKSNFGVYPAVLGGDYLYPNGTTDRAIAYWNAGGIPMIRYHMGAPPQSDTYENSQSSTNMGNVLTPGTNEYNSLISKLDYASDELLDLQNAGAAVLWAPYHESQPNGWFWWSKGSATQFIQLRESSYDYMTNTRGVNNLVWLAPSSGSPSSSWYPSKSYYDVAVPDTYESGQPFASMFSQARAIVGSTVPIPLHETGTVPQPSQMFPSAPTLGALERLGGLLQQQPVQLVQRHAKRLLELVHNHARRGSEPGLSEMMNLARIAAPLIAIGAIAGYAGYKCGDEPATTPTTAVSTYGERVGVGAQRREAPAERPQSTAEERSAIRNETKVADEHQLELLNEPLLMKKLRELAEADPELSIRLARAGNERFPDSDDAPERTWFLVKNLVNLRRFHEARAEAQLMAERHPRSSWTDDVVRHLLVYPLDQPSREEMQRKAAGQ